MLNRQYRLRDRRSVARVYRSGQTSRAGSLAIRVAANRQESSRAAVVVSKKVAKSAPVRNRIRRRLFESLRLRWGSIKPGHDLLISVFAQDVKTMPQAELDFLVDQLLDKAGLRV